jgi:uncharacterized membrane protein YkvA (DUF1232 family)
MNNEIAIPVPDLASDDHFACERSAKWNKDFKFLLRETRVITLLLRHPDVPWHAKLIAACTLGYLLSPIQVIPTFIPVIGQLDDLAVLLIGMKLLRALTPRTVLVECEAKTQESLVVGHDASPKKSA